MVRQIYYLIILYKRLHLNPTGCTFLLPRVAPGVIVIQPLRGWSNPKHFTSLTTSLLPYFLTPLLVFVFSFGLPDFPTSGLFFPSSRLLNHTKSHRIRRIQNLELLSINQKCFEDGLDLSTSRNW